MLYREAFGHGSDRVLQLYGEVLVFFVSHDNDCILIYGHFAVAEPDFPEGLKYYRHPIVILSLTVRRGADIYMAYNFVMNVYEDFAPVHRKRIKDAVEKLPKPSQKTGLSFATSDMFLNESDSQQDSQEMQGDNTFRKPSEPASSSQNRMMATMREQMERQRRENTELKEQLEQDREQSKQEIEPLLAKLDQERERSKQDMDEMKGQLSRIMDILNP